MISSFDRENLDKLLQDFYTAVGIRISIFDDEFRLVTEYPKTAPAFCSNIRKTQAGRTACRNCDNEACKRAKRLRKPHIYTCHAGLTEAITPIQLGGGVLGYAILAHMLPAEGREEAVAEACRKAEAYGVDRKDSYLALREITPRRSDQIHACVHILDAVSSYVYIHNLANWKNENISERIEKYVRQNFHLPLNSDTICRQFHCSRSSLYQISQQTFGMGIMQYINFCRIEHAKELLAAGKSIAETAEESGFSDYNYFCKVFRKATGKPPSRYRK